MREPMLLATLEMLIAGKNLKLEELGEPPLMLAEAIAARLYTGPLFVKYNGVLRGLDSTVHFLKNSMVELCCSKAVYVEYMGDAKQWEEANGTLSYEEARKKHLNLYMTTLHAINSVIVKLSKLTVVSKVYRGVSGRVLPKEFWEPNEFGVQGGIESAFMSTTLDEEVALSYAASSGGAGFVFQIQQGMVDRGADIGFLSQYPHEKEILFAPLTGLEVRSSHVQDSVLVVSVALSVNLVSLTIEQVIGKRRNLIDQMAEQTREPVKLRLRKYTMEEQGVARLKQEVLAVRKDDAEWYNDDANFLEAVKAVQRAKRRAIGQVHELRLQAMKELREGGASHAELLLEGEDAFIVDDPKWTAAAGGKEQLVKLVESSEEGRLKKLVLTGKTGTGGQLSSLPESVGNFMALKTLDLSQCNDLVCLPERVGDCVSLESLSVGSDHKKCESLKKLPERLGDCVALQKLTLNCKSLTALPESLGNCVALKLLKLSTCMGLLALPESIGNCVALEELMLQSCSSLTALPEGLAACANLEQIAMQHCTALLSIPDLSRTAGFKDRGGMWTHSSPPSHLKPWEDDKYTKAFSFTSWLDEQTASNAHRAWTTLRWPTSLTPLPVWIGECAALLTLQLDQCKLLTTLPESLGDCVALQTLNLKMCDSLTSLPERMGECVALQKLDLSYCKGLTFLPERIGKCHALQTLILSFCLSLTTLPELGECSALQRLDLSDCPKIFSVPDLSGLEQLKVQSNNDFQKPWKDGGYKAFSFMSLLCEQVAKGAELKILTLLGRHWGSLTTLPDLHECVSLTRLDLSGCSSLTALPELQKCVALQQLKLSNCSSLTALPERLSECVSLKSLDLTGCSSLSGSLPDLSGLKQVKIDWGYNDRGLPAHLKPWKESGYKAYFLSP
mgnify:CR=1 FL=1